MSRLLVFLVVVLMALPSSAALPVAVDGEELPSLAPMLKRATPAVVNIATRGQVRRSLRLPFADDPFFQRFFDVPRLERLQETSSLGSGVIVDADEGYILTNNHVIQNAYEITVTLADGREMGAEIIGRDPDTDVAVIRVSPGNLTALPMADSSRLRVGDFVVAIGNPFGLGQTVTSGIVSALGRSGLGIESFEDFIQTDAPINLGNSGGALVNLRGELVGINTAILGGGGNNPGSIGIGFAIPINMAHGIMQQLIRHGEVRRGRFGAYGQDLTPALAQAFGIDQNSGFVVTQIESDSPASRAGVEIGDIIVFANGRRIAGVDDMHNLVGVLPIGQVIELKLYRNGTEKKLSVEIQPIEISSVEGGTLLPRLAGARIGEIRKTRLQQGLVEYLEVIEVEPGSSAWEAGIREGDVLYAVNKQPVHRIDEAREAIADSRRSIILDIRRGDQELYLLIK